MLFLLFCHCWGPLSCWCLSRHPEALLGPRQGLLVFFGSRSFAAHSSYHHGGHSRSSLLYLIPSFFCATGNPPGSLAADNLVSECGCPVLCPPGLPRSGSTCLSGVLSTCIPGPVHMYSWGLVHVSRPIPRLNSSSVKIIISKLLCPKDVGGAGGTQRPLPSLTLGASSPHPQEDSSPGGSTDSSDLSPDTT